MNRTSQPPILGGNGRGKDAAEAFHTALLRIKQRETIQDKPVSLNTHYGAAESPSEPSETPSWADEIDEERKSDSWVGKCLLYLVLSCAAMGLAAFIFG